MRSDLAPGLEVAGSVSGKITYAPGGATPQTPAPTGQTRFAKAHAAAQGPLTGSLTVQGLQLSGNGLSQPIRIPKLLLAPANQPSGAGQALVATVAIPAGAAAPLTVSTRLLLSGYQLTVRGQASISRGRELARVAGFRNVAALDAITGDPVSVDLTAKGPWLLPVQAMPAQSLSLGGLSPAARSRPQPQPTASREPSPCATPPGRPITSPTPSKSPRPHSTWPPANFAGIRSSFPMAR